MKTLMNRVDLCNGFHWYKFNKCKCIMHFFVGEKPAFIVCWPLRRLIVLFVNCLKNNWE